MPGSLDYTPSSLCDLEQTTQAGNWDFDSSENPRPGICVLWGLFICKNEGIIAPTSLCRFLKSVCKALRDPPGSGNS